MSCNRCAERTSMRLCSQCQLAEREDAAIAPEVFDEEEDDDDD